ncbi:MAG: thiamine phosphate synthase [Deltaproteobacteria bacterium]|nr:thiamine phosphate synthase [Deltaproteobacteria bacterium]
MVDFQSYLITDRRGTGGRGLVDVVEMALKGGVGAVQLREKDLSARELMEVGSELREVTRRYGARFLINDRVDIALALDCDGVHLGQRGISPRDARKLLGKRGLIGVSTHGIEEARRAEEEGADFITLGPIFHTPSKAQYGDPIGVEQIGCVKREISLPIFALGGIREERVREVMDGGADGIGMISVILAAKEPSEAAASLVRALATPPS